MVRKKRGQSTLEYIIVLTAIVGAVIAGALLLGKKDNTGGIGKLMDSTAEYIKNKTADIGTIAN